MKRFFISMLILVTTLGFTACGEKKDSAVEEVENTDIVVDDEVTDYSNLSYSDLEVLAYDDDCEAQYYLGLMYEYGLQDVNQDFGKAIEWYQKAASMDYGDAVNALGYFYLNGCGVDKDFVKAKEYFDQAVLLGVQNAKVGLGRIILDTIDLKELEDMEDLAYSDSLDANASESGQNGSDNEQKSINVQTNSEKESNIDNEIESDVDTKEDTADCTTSDIEELGTTYEKLQKIEKYFSEAMDAGDLDGTYYYAYILENGIGVSCDSTKAIDLYQKVADSDSARVVDQYAINSANTALGLINIKSSDKESDSKKAIDYFSKAADNGYAKAQFYLGQCYENGCGVDRDYEKALEYYQLAAESSFAPALNQIGYLYYNGFGVDVDYSSAVYYQKLSSLQGYAPAQVNLGYLFENGFGVEQNLDTALYYYELAADEGYEGAAEAVMRVRAQMDE